MTMTEHNQLMQIAQTAILNYSGDIDVLNSALGMLFTGYSDTKQETNHG